MRCDEPEAVDVRRDGGEQVVLDAPRALDLGRDLELRAAQLVVQRPATSAISLLEGVALGVEGHALAGALHVDVVGVVDEVEGRDGEQQARHAEPQIQARRRSSARVEPVR